ncbi:hypothetical protein CEXT_457281 [Caerostris extrusa]|uniref:Uncharacterized protein n=1 Tax=Caerostris extrusa TaxID=172846 RepID=A0AAV4PTV8_CAEEX|nr:hypothetical protein CEXT_457281 [Caerostris extrusa]
MTYNPPPHINHAFTDSWLNGKIPISQDPRVKTDFPGREGNGEVEAVTRTRFSRITGYVFTCHTLWMMPHTSTELLRRVHVVSQPTSESLKEELLLPFYILEIKFSSPPALCCRLFSNVCGAVVAQW